MKPQIIGLYSPSPGCGKSTIAEYLHCYNFKTVSFARPLKLMTRVLLSQLGYPQELIQRFLIEQKEDRIPNIGVSARHILRTLGTEWGRDCVHPEVWLMCWRVSVDRHIRNGHHVVCDDVRFPNEADLIRQTGGALWRIDRPQPEPDSTHRSDGNLNDYSFDQVLENDSTVLDLYEKVDHLISPENVLVA